VNRKKEKGQEMPLVERNLAILGSPSVGKSALTLRFCKDEFTDIYDPTILKKYSHRVRNQANHVEYDLTIFDTAGLEQQSQIQTSYINSNGFILVYSIVDRESFKIVKDVYNKLVDELNGEK
jgi:small GTP-binding protein